MFRRCVAMVLTLAFGGHSALAQQRQPPSTDAAPVYVRQSNDAPELAGRLVDLEPGGLTLMANGVRHHVPWADVARIEVAGDSVVNGALIGGLLFGTLCALTCGQGTTRYGTTVALNAGLGTLIGAGIDALHTGRTTVYNRSASAMSSPGPAAAIAVRLRW